MNTKYTKKQSTLTKNTFLGLACAFDASNIYMNEIYKHGCAHIKNALYLKEQFKLTLQILTKKDILKRQSEEVQISSHLEMKSYNI